MLRTDRVRCSIRFQNQNAPAVMAQPTRPSITQCSPRYTSDASMVTGNSSSATFTHRRRIHSKKNSGTMNANDACSDGIAATAFPLLRAMW